MLACLWRGQGTAQSLMSVMQSTVCLAASWGADQVPVADSSAKGGKVSGGDEGWDALMDKHAAQCAAGLQGHEMSLPSPRGHCLGVRPWLWRI